MPDKFLTKIRYGGVDYLLKGQSDIQNASTTEAGIIKIGTGAEDAAAGNHNHDLTYLALTGGELSGALTLNADPTADMQAATKHYVDQSFAANDAMVFKGTIGTNATVSSLPTTHSAGWTYRVITAGTYAGVKCEIGDLIICITDGTTNTNAHWTVAQTNVDGAVFRSTNTFVNGEVLIADGDTGKIKTSGYTILSNVPDGAVFTDTTYTPASSVTSIAASKVVGTSTNYAREDHVHDIVVSSGSNNGTVSIAGQEVSVTGLGSAAYTNSTEYASADFLPLERSTGTGSIRHTDFEGTGITGEYSISFTGNNIITAARSMILSGGGANINGNFGNVVLVSSTNMLTLTGSGTTYTITNFNSIEYEPEYFIGKTIVNRGDSISTGAVITSVDLTGEKVEITLDKTLSTLTNNTSYGLGGATTIGSSSSCNILQGNSIIKNGLYNFVGGSQNVVEGNLSFLFGQKLSTSKNNSYMFGSGLKNNLTENIFIIGEYNELDTALNPHAFIIGQGQNKSNRKNIFSVDKEGNLDKVNNITLADNITLQYNSTEKTLDFIFA